MEINGASPTVINHEILLRKYIEHIVSGLYSLEDALEDAMLIEGADLEEFTFDEVRYLRELVRKSLNTPGAKRIDLY